jgi:hypothetical protein
VPSLPPKEPKHKNLAERMARYPVAKNIAVSRFVGIFFPQNKNHELSIQLRLVTTSGTYSTN